MSSDKQPNNIVLIMSDQHHKNVMGCAGHPLVQTPHLDALAARGTRFTNSYCNFPLCGPSRAAFMTGRHPFETGVFHHLGQYASDIPTFAHGFLAADYETVLAGRMHFVGQDQLHGFEKRIIGDVRESADIYTGSLNHVLGDLADTPGMSLTGLKKSGPGKSGYLAYDQAVTEAATQFLAQRAAAPADRPLMMVVGYVMPHCPFVAYPDDYHQYAKDIPTPTLTDDDLKNQHPALEQLRQTWGTKPMPPAEIQRRVTAAYYGMVNHLDRQVGRILKAIADAGMADNTTIIYTSDHGEQLGAHGLWWKSTFYEGSIGVPLIIAQPGQKKQTINKNVSLMDIGPTLLDLADADPLPGATGRSFRCLLEENPQDWCNEILAENTYFNVPQRMIRRGPWKYVYHHQARPQLFNLEEDPQENNDLYAAPELADLREELQEAVLDGWNPHQIAKQQRAKAQSFNLVAQWEKRAKLTSPYPSWFTTPPENYIEPS